MKVVWFKAWWMKALGAPVQRVSVSHRILNLFKQLHVRLS